MAHIVQFVDPYLSTSVIFSGYDEETWLFRVIVLHQASLLRAVHLFCTGAPMCQDENIQIFPAD